MPLARLAIEIDARRGVEAAGAQIDALAAGLGAQLAERNPHAPAGGCRSTWPSRNCTCDADAAKPGLRIGQPPAANRRSRRLIVRQASHRRRAVEIGAGRRGRRRRVVVLLRARRHQHDAVHVDAELVGHELPNFHVHALAHLGRAGRDLHRAVGVDVHQRVALVQKLRGERDAELHARHRQAADVRSRCVVEPRRSPRAACDTASGRPASRRSPANGCLSNTWPYGVMFRSPTPYRFRSCTSNASRPDVLGDRLQNVLDDRHRLRPAEAAERRVRRQIREAHLAGELDVRQEVAVVGVEQRPLHHGQRQIGRGAAVGVIRHAQA